MTDKHATIKSPLARARGLGSAKDGTHHWIMQRISAVALIPLCLFLLWNLKSVTTSDHAEFAAWLGRPANAVAMLLFVVASFYHAAVGVQVILEDYVHHELLKTLQIWLMKILFFFAGAAASYAIIAINFGF